MKTVKRLTGLEIDEVSLVDRPANQHGTVVFTKRAEDEVAYYDAAGNEVAESDIRDGDVLYTSNEADAEELVFLSDESTQALEAQGLTIEDFLASLDGEPAEDPTEVPALVGKAGGAPLVSGGPSTAFVAGKKKATRRLGAHDGSLKKSLGDSVLEELSKALTDGDRDQVISKVAERVSKAEQAAAQAVAKAAQLEAQAERAEFVDIAKGYQLPVEDDELGGILQAVSKVLSEDQLGTLDRILTAAGYGVSKSLEELGSPGYGASDVMDLVAAQANEVVGKSAGDMSAEQASTALFSANPEAYEAYLAEQR